ncbi:hypothetical protein PILCRDRAFT_825128 [Piloderma croceum F 1598]|uniref:Ricin B lectin domain-containing protein n=1 Tax=Piloderma croceum (strain F 1598) TaxID=765440 RepID=A0A0C3EYU5_PILCF|nr:hypothetical protein PILCRDRAFT_825128 [Piloderma croceum F 1598]
MSAPTIKDQLKDGDYIIVNAQKNLAIQIDKDGDVTIEEYDKANKAQQWTSKYKRSGQGDYGHYTFQSVAHEYYLSTASNVADNKVQGGRAEAQWWAGTVPETDLRLICTTTTLEWNAISVEGADHAGSTIFIRKVKPNPTKDWNQIENWGTDAKYWSFVAVKE